MNFRIAILPLITLLVLPACNSTSNVISRASVAAEVKSGLVGKNKGEVLACMGTPSRTASADGVEVMTFASGQADTVSHGSATVLANNSTATGFGSSRSLMRSCEVDIVFEGGRASRVNYRGRTGGILTQGEQCAFLVANCSGG